MTLKNYFTWYETKEVYRYLPLNNLIGYLGFIEMFTVKIDDNPQNFQIYLRIKILIKIFKDPI